MTGIYKIINKSNGDYYVGSSIDITKRWYQHKTLLRHNRHKNCHLQRAWQKYGTNTFEFVVVEETALENLIAVEQRYLNAAFLSGKQYNISPMADTSRGRITSETTKAKLRVSHLGQKTSLGMRRTKETKIKSAISHRKSDLAILVMQPNGKVDSVLNLSDYCRIHSLHQPNMCAVINGRRKSHKGFRRYENI
jgi:group I intron endonuclease